MTPPLPDSSCQQAHAVVELGPHLVQLAGERAVTISPSGNEPFEIMLSGQGWQFSGFTSSWGQEFAPVSGSELALESTSGRSTNGAMPWLSAELPAPASEAEATEPGTRAVVCCLHWSGNWRLAASADSTGARIIAELPAAGQGGAMDDLRVSIATGSDRAEAALHLVRHLDALHPASPAPLVCEWNHWWPYEDADITEDVFLAEAALAARVGFQVAVLDAGWFGESALDAGWFDNRGDWTMVNAARFPHGLPWLAEQTRSHGIGFGIWIEGEALAAASRTAADHPEWLALDSVGEPLHYLCLGSPAARDHLRRVVLDLLNSTDAAWLKWDFNLDPGTGCHRTDHGHGPDDGLRAHLSRLTEVLDAIRAERPTMVLEACSSGGLRIDAALAGHVDTFFLSDPDYTEHHLQCLWGAAQMLPARQLLHWMQSEWRGEHPHQQLDYSGDQVDLAQFDLVVRAAMLHRFGASVRLTQMRPDLLDRLTDHVRLWRERVAPLLGRAQLIPLTDQPLREGQGCRTPTFQLVGADEHLVAAYRLPPATVWEPVRLRELVPDLTYRVQSLDGGDPFTRTGRDLMSDGLLPDPSQTSVLWSVGARG